ncbi:MAG: outer membrane lipoprotein-sorting protein [Spirochaetales bacterium]|nr:outer membrane lipoprotein-sorting protein [Spirochaetales bacterium]
MKKKTILILLLAAVFPSFLAAQNVQQILDEADRSFELDGLYSESTLTVYKNGKPQAPQVMEGYQLNDSNGTARSLSIFKDPPRVSGTAYLMLGDDLWVRFASTGRIRKLSSSAKKNSAAGSDFSYADMGEGGDSFTNDYSPVLEGSEKINGEDCYKIVLSPANREAVYEKMIAWVSKGDKRYLKVEYYDKGAAVKYMTLEDYQEIGGVYYPNRVTMTSLTKKSESVVETTFIEYDSSRVQEHFFSTSYLESIR